MRSIGVGVIALLMVSCAAAYAATNPRKEPPPSYQHVFVIVEENRSFNQVVGNSNWSFFNSETSDGALATKFYANGHPSIDNYMMLTTGHTLTHDDNTSKVFNVSNVVSELDANSLTWKVYAEDLPSDPLSDGNGPNYDRHHNPFTYLANVINTPSNVANIVDFTQLASDEADGTLPAYGFIIPDDCDNGHGTANCNAALDENADAWLSQNLPPLLDTAEMQSSGLLIIMWDEGDLTDKSHGGGQIPVLMLGPQVKVNFQQASRIVYHEQSILRLMLQALGVTTFPGSAHNAPMMGEFFTNNP